MYHIEEIFLFLLRKTFDNINSLIEIRGEKIQVQLFHCYSIVCRLSRLGRQWNICGYIYIYTHTRIVQNVLSLTLDRKAIVEHFSCNNTLLLFIKLGKQIQISALISVLVRLRTFWVTIVYPRTHLHMCISVYVRTHTHTHTTRWV